MASLQFLFYAGLVIQVVGFVILTAFAVRSYLQGRRNRLPRLPVARTITRGLRHPIFHAAAVVLWHF
jgi:hypothetical protein